MSVNIAHPNPHSLAHAQKPPSPSFSTSSVPTSRSLERLLIYQRIRQSDSAIYGNPLKLSRSQSCVSWIKHKFNPPRRSFSASYGEQPYMGDECVGNFDDLSSFAVADTTLVGIGENLKGRKTRMQFGVCNMELLEPSFLGIRPERPDWAARNEIMTDIIARKANSIDLPLSLRMIKLKRLKECPPEGVRGIDRELTSTEKAFASAIYIVKEIQSQALYMRGKVLDEGLESMVEKVQMETNSSFVWLFREVFSSTPDLMTDTMVLMADFAIHSMTNHVSEASSCRFTASSRTTDHVTTLEERDKEKKEEDFTSSRLQTVTYPAVVVPIEGAPSETQGKDMSEEEMVLWNGMVMEAYEMGNEIRGEVLDHETMQQFVAPVRVMIEADEYVEYDRTHLLYQIALSEEPDNPLLLSNYAQFLFLVVGDHDRAEECFQRALHLDSTDAEVLSLYATFLWTVRKDLWGAEERYLQAVAAAPPSNAYHASVYASFLWSTGGEDTCYPLDSASDSKS